MSDTRVLIVGAGIVGATMAHALTAAGHRVTILEKGGAYPYPHWRQFDESVRFLHRNPARHLPADLKSLSLAGDYHRELNNERFMRVGGSATRWEAITLRMMPKDFRTRTLFGHGDDWPLSYDELEPYYCRAEALLGVSGTDGDNPFAPARSRPYPLPPFELSYGDRLLGERLASHGIKLHTTPQARTRRPYEGRNGCVNYGTCGTCPIGARYSPNHHIEEAIATGLCALRTDVSVRRVVLDGQGRARAVVVRENHADRDEEIAADVIVVAAGALASARLLLLSRDERHPDGVGNGSGHVGRNLTFHHIWYGSLEYAEPLYPGRFGGWTGQSHQFLDPEARGRHGAVKVEFSTGPPGTATDVRGAETGAEVIEAMKGLPHSRSIGLHAESVAGETKYAALSSGSRDRFGDPFLHVHYESSAFDLATYEYAKTIFERFRSATKARDDFLAEPDRYHSGCHHMGTCRMGEDESDSVTDHLGRVHGSPNLFVVGGSNFVGTSGAVNPTLTMVALAARSADHIAEELL